MRERLRRPGGATGEQEAQAAVAAPGKARRATEDHPPPFSVRPHELEAALGPGQPLTPAAGGMLRRTLGHDFGRVRVHADARGDHVARSLGADALAFGERMVFRGGLYAPGTPHGDALLAHEGAHLAAGTGPGGTRGGTPVQLAVGIDDVAQEMVGMPFVLRSPQGTAPNRIPGGVQVKVTAWPAGYEATVSYTQGTTTITLTVPKLELNPAYTAVAGVRQYKVGLSGQQDAVEDHETKASGAWGNLADWRGKKDQYKKKPQVWQEGSDRLEKEVANQEALLEASQLQLSRMLVRETMYNRFDAIIAQWVNHYNLQFSPTTNLDPNLVKSLLFEESRLGTQGPHLEMGPYAWTDAQRHPVRARYNVGQAIDSYAHQQLLMIEEMAPAIYTAHRLDELKKADKANGMTEKQMLEWNGGELSTAMQEFFARRNAGANLMGTAGRDLHEDYAFWIRTTIRWLFYKYLSLDTPSWPEAVRAYNGSGARAEAYSRRVVARAKGTGALNVGNK